MKENIANLINAAQTTTYEGNGFYHFDGMLCDRERLPECIVALLPKVLHKVFIPWEEMQDFGDLRKNWLAEKIAPELEQELKGSFFKLSGRSSKDSDVPKFMSCEQVKMTVEDSMRWYDDLCYLRKYRFGTYLWFLEWLDDCSIEKEVRVFVYDGKVKGITAYNYQKKAYAFTDGFMEKVKQEVEDKVLSVLANMHFLKRNWEMNEFVIDAYERADGSVQFLEINPYWHSDPCCYENHSKIGDPLFCIKRTE